jgi:hypothetical protein
MRDFYKKYGPWAVVTGASSGIGEEFCMQLAKLKFNLVLVARRAERLEQLSESLKSGHGIETKVIALDVSDPGFIHEIESVTKDIDVGLLINNAGFALTGDFLSNSLEEEVKLLDVNCKAPIVLAHTFGKVMREKGRGGIINVASFAGFLPMPRWANYSASKAYLLRFSEALNYELRDKNVPVLALCPSGTKTEFFQVAGIKSHGMEVSKVVNTGLENLGKNAIAIPKFGDNISATIMKFLPRKMLTKVGAKVVKVMEG